MLERNIMATFHRRQTEPLTPASSRSPKSREGKRDGRMKGSLLLFFITCRGFRCWTFTSVLDGFFEVRKVGFDFTLKLV